MTSNDIRKFAKKAEKAFEMLESLGFQYRDGRHEHPHWVNPMGEVLTPEAVLKKITSALMPEPQKTGASEPQPRTFRVTGYPSDHWLRQAPLSIGQLQKLVPLQVDNQLRRVVFSVDLGGGKVNLWLPFSHIKWNEEAPPTNDNF